MWPITYIRGKIKFYKYRANRSIKNVFESVFRGGMFSLAFFALIWISILAYVLFYYTFVPSTSYVRPIYLQIQACKETNKEKCPYPSAHVRLTKRQQLLMLGQQYKFFAHLEMPESPVNKKLGIGKYWCVRFIVRYYSRSLVKCLSLEEGGTFLMDTVSSHLKGDVETEVKRLNCPALGMFMVCLRLTDRKGFLASHSCRSNMLRYHSDILHIINLILLSPFYLFGSNEEKQIVTFELYSDYEEDQNHPVTDIYIEVQSHDIEIYAATLNIHAHLSGLRYFMYYWPLSAAVLGTIFNACSIFFLAALSIYHRYFVQFVPTETVRMVAEAINGRDKGDDESITPDSAKYSTLDPFDLDSMQEKFLEVLNKKSGDYTLE